MARRVGSWPGIWALLCLLLTVQVAVAYNVPHMRRQDRGTAPAPTAAPPPPTTSETPSSLPPSESASGTTSTSLLAVNVSSTAAPIPTVMPGNDTFTNSSIFNATIPEGELPIQPQITPGWAVSGVLLLCTGAVYALIGIKNPWIHTFFSTAYLASLGTAVLIVYVMVLPVSDTIQGAYVVAVAMTGIVLGGAATVFKEITEGLGCLLGGFCLSMWMLCLQPGGLLPGTAPKVIFITCFSLGGFAFYFSHYTRDYALIGMISFAGATITVLGIDCFSRAGLKEFWAYTWDLNDNLFPLGTVTYPVTKGIRVETAAIIILFLAGLVSQLKLWRLIKERRTKRAAERAEGQRQLAEEEENLGRQIEAANARERRQWERTYGDGDGDVRSVNGSGDSGVGDMDSEKKMRSSNGITSTRAQSPMDNVIEMAEMPSPETAPAVPPKSPTPGLMLSEDSKDGKITVRVARDDSPSRPDSPDIDGEQEQKIWVLGPDGQVQAAEGHRTLRRMSRGLTSTPEPVVVPLPFKVPEPDRRLDDDRSSVATFADEPEDSVAAPVKRHSLAKRLSQGSAQLLRSLSQRTTSEVHGSHSDSKEELVIPRTRRLDDDDGSIAATIDNESLDGDRSTMREGEGRRSIRIQAELASPNLTSEGRNSKGEFRPLSLDLSSDLQPRSMAEGESNIVPQTAAVASRPASPTKIAAVGEAKADDEAEEDAATMNPTSVASVATTPAALTQDHLPKALSKVAMSYRTNEWAKHLSHADMPEPETLQIHDYPETETTTKDEAPRRLNVEELQQTPENGAPAPAQLRSVPAHSAFAPPVSISRSNSRQSTAGPPLRIPNAVTSGRESPSGSSPVTPSSAQPASGYVNRNSSTAGTGATRRAPSRLQATATPEEDRRNASTSTTPIPEEHAGSDRSSVSPSPDPSETFVRPTPVPGVVSYSSPQTLIGQRDMLLRNRSYASFAAPSPDPFASTGSLPQRAPSVVGSVYDYPPAGYGSPVMPDDDMPLSQRRELMRQNSLLLSQTSLVSRSSAYHPINADATPFDSHQPQRGDSHLPTPAARQAQLASFRQSVAADLRAGNVIVASGGNGRDSALGASTTSLLPGQYGPGVSGLGLGRDGEVQRNIEDRRTVMLSQKEAEARAREMQRWEKERSERAMEERMRKGDLLDAHREAMKRMQSGAKNR